MRKTLGASAFGLCILVASSFFWRPALRGWALLPAASYYDTFPWKYYRPIDLPEGRNVLSGDISAHTYPYVHYTITSLRERHVPLWNPWILSGAPFLANGESGVFDPVVVGAALLPVPVPHTFLLMAIARLALCGWFLWLWVRRLGGHYVGALLAGLSFMTCQFIVAWLEWPLTAAAIWIGLVLWAIEGVLQKRTHGVAWLSVSVALALTPGHIETSFHVFVWSLSYALLRVLLDPSLRRELRSMYGKIVGSALLGMLLAAPLLFPMAQYILQSSAFEVGRSDLGSASLSESIVYGVMGDPVVFRTSLSMLPALSSPIAFGTVHGLYSYRLPSTNFNEQFGYVSLVSTIVVLLNISAIWRHRTARLLVFLGIGAVLVSFRAPLFNFINYLPLFRLVANQRAHFLFALSIASCAGLMLPKRSMLFGIGLCLLVIADAYTWIPSQYPSLPAAYAYPETPEIQKAKEDAHGGRIIAPDWMFPPNSSMVYSLFDSRGYEIVRPRRYELLVGKYLTTRANYTLLFAPLTKVKPFLDLTATKIVFQDNPSESLRTWESGLPRAYLVSSVARVQSAQEALDKITHGFDYTKSALIESSTPGVVQGDGITQAEIVVDNPEEVHVQINAEHEGWLVLLDSFYEGWKADIDGEETTIYPANVAFRAVRIPQGTHSVRFIYDPWVFKAGVLVSVLTASLMLFMVRGT